MNSEERIRLFAINNAVIQTRIDRVKGVANNGDARDVGAQVKADEIDRYISQYSESSRTVAQMMSKYYMLFHMLENEIRNFVEEVLEEQEGEEWWINNVPQQVREYAEGGRKKKTTKG